MASKKKFDRSDLISVMALLMSMGAVFVSLKQTSILRDQQEVMSSQQEGSAWPHLIVIPSLSFGNDTITFTYAIENKGVGPAIITNFDFSSVHKIETMDDFSDILAISNIGSHTSIQFDHPSDNILSAGETLDCIKLIASAQEESYAEFGNLMKYFNDAEYCYTSIYKTQYGNACK